MSLFNRASNRGKTVSYIEKDSMQLSTADQASLTAHGKFISTHDSILYADAGQGFFNKIKRFS